MPLYKLTILRKGATREDENVFVVAYDIAGVEKALWNSELPENKSIILKVEYLSKTIIQESESKE